MLARGSVQDKLRWTFSLYDINNDGMITKDELSRIVTAIYDLMGKSVEPMVDDFTSNEHVERVFQVLNRCLTARHVSSIFDDTDLEDN